MASIRFQGMIYLTGPRKAVSKRHSEIAEQWEKEGKNGVLFYFPHFEQELDLTQDTGILLDTQEINAFLQFVAQKFEISNMPSQSTAEEQSRIIFQLSTQLGHDNFQKLAMQYWIAHRDFDAAGQAVQKEYLA